jgi:hypothetical protein
MQQAAIGSTADATSQNKEGRLLGGLLGES